MTTNSPLRKPLILVVDDAAVMREFCRQVLTQAGFDVALAEGGGEALDLFALLKPDLVLLDVVMPGMDGFALCSELRLRPHGADIPIIMVTGLDDPESIQKAFEIGATDFITKPINETVLANRARYVLRANKAFYELAENKTRLATAQRIARLGYWELSPEENLFRLSAEASCLLGLGLSSMQLNYGDFFSHIHPEDLARVKDVFRSSLTARTPFSLHYKAILPQGHERIIFSQGEFSHDAEKDSPPLVGIIQDVSAFKQAEEQIRMLAFYDSLTGLANRLLFKDRCEQALSYAARHDRLAALLYLDLDRFKRINDTFGHSIGDLLLQEVARRLNHCLRRTDTASFIGTASLDSCVSRLGGDEFSILLGDLGSSRDVAKIARRIISAVSQPLHLEGFELCVTTSVGISLFPTDGDTVDALLKNADTAMYYAKDQGRDNFQFYQESMNASALERLGLERDIRKALERDEFQLYFQPQLSSDTGEVVGAEALIRWNHPERGLIYPDEFIHIAEDSGLIIAINEWVLRAACKQSKSWAEAGYGRIRIAVNLSGKNTTILQIAETVTRALRESCLDSHRLELEITESTIMQKEEETTAALHMLKDMGMQIAIDDFGTGYSSLSYLKNFPIDTLKIDRSFITDLSPGNKNAAIIKSIITMAHSLDLNVVAEGVENKDQLAFLRKLGCNEIQGFLFSGAVPADIFVGLLKRDHAW
ncbi:EAL domain-containing protein [Desulfuromonas sp. AOP6]|uniref:putative bifunctional diguanylate cyclase/phosphodiesterase n=1 Tax=Desulfuromonas sp. AOP6 TaxID=1566351 RepID=UPI001280AEC8|nr:EAL domain-containing protein [Desulfuromonas sp. AOP6]BCA80998.1 two-component system response regulator [Desulfuromonas sp. AOP6]